MATTRAIGAVLTLMILVADEAHGQEIIVKSADDVPSSGSEFLRVPGDSSDPYAPAVDWARVPPWRQTQFFGIRAQGKTFLYVVDCSGSMGQHDRLVRAKREIRRSINAMRFPQRFQIIFYNDRPIAMPGGTPQGVDFGTKAQFAMWMNTVDADGETDPRTAMAQALALKPDGVFLLSDGEFPPGTIEAIAKTNVGKTPIHCVDFSGKSEDLKTIAKSSGGQYASRP